MTGLRFATSNISLDSPTRVGISLRNISKFHGDRQILSGLSVDFRPGEFTVVLGPSGCGKSTLLRLIAGLDEVTSGEVRIGDVDVTRDGPGGRGCTMVFQNYALYPHMTVRQNIAYALKLAKLSQSERERRVTSTAGLLGIQELLERKPNQLSGGQRQRVAIARALARQQKVLLLDEPLSNLDAKLRHGMRSELRRIHDELGTTTVLVTHDQTEAMTLADSVVLLNKGRIEQVASAQAIYHRPESIFVAGFIGTPPMNLLKAKLISSTQLQLSDGQVLSCSPCSGFAPGSLVCIGIRPEAVSVVTEGGAAWSLVESIENLGSHQILYCRLGDDRLLINHTGRPLGAGEGVRLAFATGSLSLFDPSTEKRLDVVQPIKIEEIDNVGST